MGVRQTKVNENGGRFRQEKILSGEYRYAALGIQSAKFDCLRLRVTSRHQCKRVRLADILKDNVRSKRAGARRCMKCVNQLSPQERLFTSNIAPRFCTKIKILRAQIIDGRAGDGGQPSDAIGRDGHVARGLLIRSPPMPGLARPAQPAGGLGALTANWASKARL